MNCTDNTMASKCAEIAYNFNGPLYVRLDREPLPDIYNKNETFKDGLTQLRKGKDVCIISTGNMVHKALDVADLLKKKSITASVIDLYRLKPVNYEKLISFIKQCKKVVTLEEHLINGGIGSIVAEIMVDNNVTIPLKRIAIPDKYCYTYGGRESLRRSIGLDTTSVENTITSYVK